LEDDRYFADAAHCLEWFVEDGIGQNTDLFVLNGDLTTYKQTIRERKFWVDTVIRMADHAPVILVAGNHGKELEDDLYPLWKVKGKHPVFLCIEPEFIELGEAAISQRGWQASVKWKVRRESGSGLWKEVAEEGEGPKVSRCGERGNLPAGGS